MSKTTAEAMHELKEAVMDLIDEILQRPKQIIMIYIVFLTVSLFTGTFAAYLECMRAILFFMLLYLINKR